MHALRFTLQMFGIYVMSLLMASDSDAQMLYKWVDADGRTHYSQNKDAAGNARTEELKFKTPPTSSEDANSRAQYWRDKEREFQARQALREKPYAPSAMPRSLSGGKDNGTDASRCALGRDVLSGAVKHRNGASTDQYDREIAENDVHMFCH